MVILCLYFSGANLHSQSIAMEVIGSVGSFDETVAGSSSWMIGEPVVESVFTSTGVLTQGFQQSWESLLVRQIDYSGLEFQLAPNPTTSKIRISDLRNMEIELIDLKGKILFKARVDSNPHVIDLSNFPNGVYLLKILADNHFHSGFIRIVKI